jgi:hypothetical protein
VDPGSLKKTDPTLTHTASAPQDERFAMVAKKSPRFLLAEIEAPEGNVKSRQNRKNTKLFD